jgi:hypothetical protein
MRSGNLESRIQNLEARFRDCSHKAFPSPEPATIIRESFGRSEFQIPNSKFWILASGYRLPRLPTFRISVGGPGALLKIYEVGRNVQCLAPDCVRIQGSSIFVLNRCIRIRAI